MGFVDTVKKKVDVYKLLSHYGAQRISGRGQVRSTCPIHGGDNPTAFVIHEHEKVYWCHTGCKSGGDVIDLVMRIDEVDFKTAVETLANMFGVPIDWQMEDLDDDRFSDEAKEFIKRFHRLRDNSMMPIYDPGGERKRIKAFRKFLPKTMQHFDIHVRLGGELDARIVMPLEDENNRIVGASGRKMKKEQFAKWMHKPKGLKTGDVLPGLGRNKDAILASNEIIITEGIFDSARLWEAGMENVVSVMSANITQDQINIMQKYATAVVIGFDHDEAGKEAIEKAIKKLQPFFDVYILDLPDGLDPCDSSHEQLQKAYRNKLKPYQFKGD